MEAKARHRTHSTEFKRQLVQEYLSGETLHGLAKRYDISRSLILSSDRGALQSINYFQIGLSDHAG
jgi:transposase-like protein